jgi:hypothetical protein
MKTISLKELGQNLPVPVDGKKNLSFSFKSWGLDEEKEIGEMKRKSQYMGPFISKVLSHMIEDLCGEKFSKMDENARELLLSKMPMMNVLYLWIYLRYDQLDEMIRLDVGCPGCGRMNKNFVASLSGLDVDVPEKADDPIAQYKLKKPFKLTDKDAELTKVLKFSRTPWFAMDTADDEVTTNQGMIMELMFSKSIVGTDGEEGFIDLESINKKIRKRDFEFLSNAIQKHNAGPSLAIEGKCHYCPTKFYRQLDWNYDTFFGSSSLPID